jgi:hypothetical protein
MSTPVSENCQAGGTSCKKAYMMTNIEKEREKIHNLRKENKT